MQFKSYSSVIFAFVLLFLAVAAYMFFTYGGIWYVAVIPSAISAIGLLVLKAPIDRYFFKFQEVGLVDKVKGMLKLEYPVIQSYSTEKQAKFFERLFYFAYDRDCYMVAEESDELDLYHKLIILAPGVILGIDGPVDEARDVERIAAYRHPFPSPKMRFLHAAEYDEEDGVIIVSLEHLLNSQHVPDKYLPISYFMWAERKLAKFSGFPKLPTDFEIHFKEIWGFTKKSVEDFIGYELKDLDAVAICAYAMRKNELSERFPKFAAEIQAYLQA